jgi:hypothetical protein
LAAVVVAAALVAGCKHGDTKSASAPAPPPPIARSGVTRAHEKTTSVPGPVAHPADPLDRSNSHLALEVRPFGSVPFDSMTLPLVGLRSVGGVKGRSEFVIAAQYGASPGWAALLADGTRDAISIPGGLRISAFRASAEPAGGGNAKERGTVEAIAWARPLPRGLLLGRSCDERGFLVESPRPDGSRWIGRAAWDSGEIQWLAQERGVAAFGVLGPHGELAYSRQKPADPSSPAGPFELVVRAPGASGDSDRTLALPGVSLVLPVFSADGARVFVFAVAMTEGARLRVLDVELGTNQPLVVDGETELNVEASIASAYQAVLCVQTPWHAPITGPLSRGLAIMSGESASMVWLDPASGTIAPLARGTVGAAPVLDSRGSEARGLLLGAAAELIYQPLAANAAQNAEFSQEGSVLKGSFVPRTLGAGPGAKYILISPPMAGKSEEVRLYEIRPREVRENER